MGVAQNNIDIDEGTLEVGIGKSNSDPLYLGMVFCEVIGGI